MVFEQLIDLFAGFILQDLKDFPLGTLSFYCLLFLTFSSF